MGNVFLMKNCFFLFAIKIKNPQGALHSEPAGTFVFTTSNSKGAKKKCCKHNKSFFLFYQLFSAVSPVLPLFYKVFVIIQKVCKIA